MATELWIRNPTGCIREVIAAGENKITFDAGYVGKRNNDPFAFMKLHFGVQDFQMMIIRQEGAQHFLSDDLENPIGVYPVWDASSDSMAWLEEWCQNPVGEDAKLCADKKFDDTQRPVFGQANRIVVMSVPSIKTLRGKQALTIIHEVNQDYPDVEFLIHGLYSFMPLINLGFSAYTFEPRESALHKTIFLPNGKKVKTDEGLARYLKWIELLGFTLADMNDPKKRCEFNVRAAKWATINGRTPTAFIQKASTELTRPDPNIPDLNYRPRTGGKMLTRSLGVDGRDKIDCDTCSLVDSCKSYREGSVCTLPESDMNGLAEMFNTTDTSTLLRGMARLTALSAQRVETAMAFEDNFGLDPEVTKLVKNTFDMAERYAKLNDPMLRASVNFNNNRDIPGAVSPARPDVLKMSPQQISAMAIEHYRNLGIASADITREMMTTFIQSHTTPAELPAAQ